MSRYLPWPILNRPSRLHVWRERSISGSLSATCVMIPKFLTPLLPATNSSQLECKLKSSPNWLSFQIGKRNVRRSDGRAQWVCWMDTRSLDCKSLPIPVNGLRFVELMRRYISKNQKPYCGTGLQHDSNCFVEWISISLVWVLLHHTGALQKRSRLQSAWWPWACLHYHTPRPLPIILPQEIPANFITMRLEYLSANDSNYRYVYIF